MVPAQRQDEVADHCQSVAAPDLAEWKALLADAGVRDARLHDARHTAATVLLLLEVPERAVMEFMGWSNTTMTKRYQHVTAVLRGTIAKRLNGFLQIG